MIPSKSVQPGTPKSTAVVTAAQESRDPFPTLCGPGCGCTQKTKSNNKLRIAIMLIIMVAVAVALFYRRTI